MKTATANVPDWRPARISVITALFAAALAILVSCGGGVGDDDAARVEPPPPQVTGTTPLPPVGTTPKWLEPPPGPPVPPGLSPPRVRFESLDRALRRLPTGAIAYNAPEELVLDEVAEIELVLSPQKTVEQLKPKIKAVGRRYGARVKISDRMEATLTGSPRHRVDIQLTQGKPTQRVGAKEDTVWRWDVVPTREGKLKLHLRLTAFLIVNGEREAKPFPSYDREWTVQVAWSDRMKDFVRGNWQWLWTIFVPVGLWGFRRLWKRRAPKAKRRTTRAKRRAPGGKRRRQRARVPRPPKSPP